MSVLQGISSTPNRWPTLFDALRAAQGVTPYSDLTQVNIRLFDDAKMNVRRSEQVVPDQLLAASITTQLALNT
ncbi:hypothetical protein [Synechococcus sp. NB0720_010]|uniref:hypothetical protein n=1 Tax=Synechococcus sp. NB0720_010 TaxID=2907159 RepID=UPI001FF8975E|nr:hypothetical protein [Synechococcus sp. NB0720_010]UPH89144.1 hypothetical protein LY254_07450 [Synechococcus sp. NB0720_010]